MASLIRHRGRVRSPRRPHRDLARSEKPRNANNTRQPATRPAGSRTHGEPVHTAAASAVRATAPAARYAHSARARAAERPDRAGFRLGLISGCVSIMAPSSARHLHAASGRPPDLDGGKLRANDPPGPACVLPRTSRCVAASDAGSALGAHHGPTSGRRPQGPFRRTSCNDTFGCTEP